MTAREKAEAYANRLPSKHRMTTRQYDNAVRHYLAGHAEGYAEAVRRLRKEPALSYFLDVADWLEREAEGRKGEGV